MAKLWSTAEENFLKNNYSSMLNKDIASKLDRSIKAIKQKASAFGLRKREEYRQKYSKETLNYDYSPLTKLEVCGRTKMKKYELSINVGDRVKIIGKKYDSKKLKIKTEIEGVVIHKNQYFITVKSDNYLESFKISDFYTKIAKIQKMEVNKCN